VLRRLLLLILLTLIAVQLTACTNKSLSEDSYVQENNDPKLKEATLTIYLAPNGGRPLAPDFKFRIQQQVLKELEKRCHSKLNVRLVIGNLSGNKEILITPPYDAAAIKGDSFDIFIVSTRKLTLSNVVVENRIKRLAMEGIAADITDIFPKHAPRYYRMFTDHELNAVKYDERIWAIPSYNLPYTTRLCAIVREDIMDKYGIKDIKSFDDYEEYLNIVRYNEPDITPLTFHNNSEYLFAGKYGYTILDYFNLYGNRIPVVYKSNDPDMKLMAWEHTPEYKTAVDTLLKWNSRGYVKEYSFSPLHLKPVCG